MAEYDIQDVGGEINNNGELYHNESSYNNNDYGASEEQQDEDDFMDVDVPVAQEDAWAVIS